MKKFIAIGEILWDVFPHKKVWGGAPANAIFYAQQLGLDATMFSAIGKDSLGRELIAATEKVDLNLYAPEVEHPTGSVNVTLDTEGNASYEIVENSAWDFVPFDEHLNKASRSADLIIFGTLAQRNSVTRESIFKAVEHKKNSAKILCDINLRQDYYSKAILENSLRVADFLKINEEELAVLKDLLGLTLKELIKYFNIELIILTLGADGSEIHTAEHCFKHGAFAGEVIDTVGAGDSFTACFMSHYLTKGDIKSAQAIASKLAAYVCSNNGATVTIPEKLLG